MHIDFFRARCYYNCIQRRIENICFGLNAPGTESLESEVTRMLDTKDFEK